MSKLSTYIFSEDFINKVNPLKRDLLNNINSLVSPVDYSPVIPVTEIDEQKLFIESNQEFLNQAILCNESYNALKQNQYALQEKIRIYEMPLDSYWEFLKKTVLESLTSVRNNFRKEQKEVSKETQSQLGLLSFNYFALITLIVLIVLSSVVPFITPLTTPLMAITGIILGLSTLASLASINISYKELKATQQNMFQDKNAVQTKTQIIEQLADIPKQMDKLLKEFNSEQAPISDLEAPGKQEAAAPTHSSPLFSDSAKAPASPQATQEEVPKSSMQNKGS